MYVPDMRIISNHTSEVPTNLEKTQGTGCEDESEWMLFRWLQQQNQRYPISLTIAVGPKLAQHCGDPNSSP